MERPILRRGGTVRCQIPPMTLPTSLCLLLGLSLSVSARQVHVSPAGTSAGAGTSASPLDVRTALTNAKAGDTIQMAGGKYAISYKTATANTILCATKATQASPIVVQAPMGQTATLDFQFAKDDWVQDGFGLSLTGNWWTFRRIAITRAGYQGVYVTGSNNTFEHCAFYENRNSGIEINKGGSYTTLRYCDAYRNYDPKKLGTMADGFAPKQTQGPGNRLIGCRAWENSDDGYDAFDSPEVVTFDSCWAFRNGIDVMGWGAVGNGNGFKVGGNGAVAPNILRHCVAFGNPKKGFDQNNNLGAITLLNCTGYLNGTYDFAFGTAPTSGKHVVRNCVSYKSQTSFASGTTQEKNSWNLGLSLANSDFESLDTSLARVARNPDGTLPVTKLLFPSAGSKLLDKGAALAWSYVGSAPDLGAFERGAATGVEVRAAAARTAASSRPTVRVRNGWTDLPGGHDLLGRHGPVAPGWTVP